MEAESEELKKASVKAFSQKLRSAILTPESEEDLSSIWKAASIHKTLAIKKADTIRSLPPPPPHAEGPKDADGVLEDIESFVNQVYEEASEALGSTEALIRKSEDQDLTAKRDVKFSRQEDQIERSKDEEPSKPQGKSKKSPLKGRPAWALSEDQAEALDEEEEKELLGFADGLDLDDFLAKLEDVDLQEAFKSLQENESKQQGGDEKAWKKSFVAALNRAAYKRVATGGKAEDEAESMADSHISKASHTSRMRTEATIQKIHEMKGEGEGDPREEGRVGAGGEWDARTTAAQRGLRDAEEFLLSHPELKTVHSTASVRAMIQKMEHDIRSAPHLPK